MWFRFTERARRVVYYAQEEARGRGETEVSPADILIGLLAEPDGIAVRILKNLGVSPEQIRPKLAQRTVPSDGKGGNEMRLSRRSVRVIDRMYDERRRLRNKHVGEEHLLLGLLHDGSCVTGEILASFGVDIGKVRREVQTMQGEIRVALKAEPRRPGSLVTLARKVLRLDR